MSDCEVAGGSVAEQLECWTCNLEAQRSSSPALPSSWNFFAGVPNSSQQGFLTLFKCDLDDLF